MYKLYDGCRNAFGSTNGPTFRGGRRDFRVTLEIMRVAIMINAIARTDHPNPIWGINFSRVMGYITAPTEEPEATIPKAAARRRLNHVDTTATPGMKSLTLGTCWELEITFPWRVLPLVLEIWFVRKSKTVEAYRNS